MRVAAQDYLEDEVEVVEVENGDLNTVIDDMDTAGPQPEDKKNILAELVKRNKLEEERKQRENLAKKKSWLGSVATPEQLEKGTNTLRKLVDIYFQADEGEDVVAEIAGSKEKKFALMGKALDMDVSLIQKLEETDEASSRKEIWATHPEYKELVEDIKRDFMMSLPVQTALRQGKNIDGSYVKEPALLFANVFLARFSPLLGKDNESRFRWMRSPLWGTQKAFPFEMVFQAIQEVMEEDNKKVLAKFLS